MANYSKALGYRDEIWVTVLIVLTSIGFVVAFGLWTYTLYKIITLEIRTRNLWLSQVALLFIFLSYGACFIFVPTPNTAICAAIRFLPGFCYSGLFASLLLKSMNIISESRNILVPAFYQVTLFMCVVAVQVVIGAQWLIMVPPAVLLAADSDRGNETLLCSSSVEEIILSFIYEIVLVFILCIVSSVARKSTVVHREEAFLISVCVGFIIPIWICWTLLGTLGPRRSAYEDPCLAFGLLATTTLILVLIFLPRARRLSKFSRSLHHVSFGESNGALTNKAYTVNTNPSLNSTNIGVGNLTKNSLHQSTTSLHSASQFSPQDAIILAQNRRSTIGRLPNQQVMGNTRPESRIYLTPNIPTSFHATPVYITRDNSAWIEGGTHL